MSCHTYVTDAVFVLSVCGGEGGSDDGDDYTDNSVSGGPGEGGPVVMRCW